MKPWQMLGILRLVMNKKMKIEKRTSAETLSAAPLLAIEQLAHQLGPTMVFAPHPDDESLGCGGLIKYLSKQHAEVSIVFLTSGDASHPNSKSHSPAILAELREKEAINACTMLGVKTSNIYFLKLKDSKLHKLPEKDRNATSNHISTLLKDCKISSVLVPWRRDPHTGHMATYNLVKTALENKISEIQIIEYPIWLWKNSTKKDWPKYGEAEMFRLDITDVLNFKKDAIFAHRSQTANIIKDDVEGFQLSQDLLSPFLTSFEYYFFDIKKDRNSLEQEYFDTLYNNNPDPWNFEKSKYEHTKFEAINKLIGDSTYKKGLELGCSIGVQTKYLAKHCGKLKAVDISETAIKRAKKLNPNLEDVHFETVDIAINFPQGKYDLISMCEIGYYFNKQTLNRLFEKIYSNLNKKGHFLLVDWTSFVREYPLTGMQVHKLFYTSSENRFRKISEINHDSYEILLFEKL